MKKFLVAGIAAAAFCGTSAYAADMPQRPPAYKAAPAAYDPWTGFYAGGSVGARWSEVDWTSVTLGAIVVTNVNNPAPLDNTSVRVGGYFGYTWRVAPTWLAGLEADIAWGNNKKSATPLPGNNFPAATGHDFVTTKLDWDGSLRGRLGVLVNPAWLVYATGGVAWQQIKNTESCDGTGASVCNPPGGSASISKIQAGWTVGGGVETILSNNWFGRVEYRYADFGRVTNFYTLPFAAPFTSNTATVSVKTNSVLLGLAYKY